MAVVLCSTRCVQPNGTRVTEIVYMLGGAPAARLRVIDDAAMRHNMPPGYSVEDGCVLPPGYSDPSELFTGGDVSHFHACFSQMVPLETYERKHIDAVLNWRLPEQLYESLDRWTEIGLSAENDVMDGIASAIYFDLLPVARVALIDLSSRKHLRVHRYRPILSLKPPYLREYANNSWLVAKAALSATFPDVPEATYLVLECVFGPASMERRLNLDPGLANATFHN